MRSSAGSLKRNALDLSLDNEEEDEYGYTTCKYFFFSCSRARRLTRLRCKMRFQCFHAWKLPTVEFDFFSTSLKSSLGFWKIFTISEPISDSRLYSYYSLLIKLKGYYWIWMFENRDHLIERKVWRNFLIQILAT